MTTEVRRAAASALGKLGPLGTAAMPALRDLVARDSDGPVAATAIVSIGQLINLEAIDYFQALIAALQDEEQYVRIGAAKELMYSGTRASLAGPALIVALRDQNASVRFWAAGALGAHQSQAAIEPLRALLRDSDRSVRETAASILSSLGQEGRQH